MKKLLVAASISLFLAAIAGAQAAKKPASAGNPTASIQKEFVAAANAKDVAKVTSLYSDDAVLMPPNSPMAKGHAAIQAFWKGMIDAGARDVVVTSIGGSVHGDIAYDAGTYAFSLNGPGGAAVSDKGKYLLVAKRGASGKWLVEYDAFNSDLPCPGGAAK